MIARWQTTTGFRRFRIFVRRNRWVQAAGLFMLWWLCDRAVRVLGVPVPGAIVGLGLLLVLLASGRFSHAWVRRGASGLLDHLMLFFVPAMLALVDHPDLFSLTGLKLLGIVMAGTLLVMSGTAAVVELSLRRKMGRDHA
ncbi:CidA/LrgA family protein [Termitidicoccus mucosus]|uniref:Murein hydrolase transporter LrgA n=1 Tax=Termitidicoccus mucosus TaxID=1184151 RepID=A0A178IF58_9BACT|nr:murein hydrolase transporter LrgA [Opitutaceae bacterium TSB47]